MMVCQSSRCCQSGQPESSFPMRTIQPIWEATTDFESPSNGEAQTAIPTAGTFNLVGCRFCRQHEGHQTTHNSPSITRQCLMYNMSALNILFQCLLSSTSMSGRTRILLPVWRCISDGAPANTPRLGFSNPCLLAPAASRP